jgi:hypothetical protein
MVSTSSHQLAVLFAGNEMHAVEQGTLTNRPLSESGGEGKRSSTRIGTVSVSPPCVMIRNAPLLRCALSRGMRRETVSSASAMLSMENVS